LLASVIDPTPANTKKVRLSVWTGHEDNKSSQISFGAGKNSERLSNVCLIKIPSEGPARNRLLHFDKVKEIITLLVQNWDPDVVVLNSRELSNKLDVMNEIGWVTYRKKLKGRIKLSDKIVHESDFLGGHLFYLKTDNSLIYHYSLISEYQSLKKQIA
jgi:hypothetical protein